MRQKTSVAFKPGLRLMRSELVRYGIGMGVLSAFLLLAQGWCSAGCGEETSWWFASIGIVALVFLSGQVVFRLLYRDPNALWTPAVLFPLGTVIYFGFGSASTLFSDEITREYLLRGNYGLGPTGLILTTLLTTLGVTVCLFMMQLTMRLQFGQDKPNPVHRRGLSLPTTAIFFVVIGALLKYGLVLPEQYGLINVTVPGSLKSMTGLIDLGLAVMMFMAAQGKKVWLIVFMLIWPIHLGLSLLEFSKKVVMFAILLPAAGAFLGHQNWKRLIPWVAFAALAFNFLQDINTSARLTILDQTGVISDADFGERIDLLDSALSGEFDLTEMTSVARAAAQVWWLRLNYSGAQLRAMELYDAGQPGEWTLSFAEAFVPRFLWPDKPESTAHGRIFNRIVSGYEGARTRVGMSVYANGYWLMGWPGLVIFSAVMGAILGIVTRVNYRFVVERQLIYLPMIFLGMRMAALGPTGYLQKTFVAAMPIFLGYLLLIFVLQNLLTSRSKRKRVHVAPNLRSQPV